MIENLKTSRFGGEAIRWQKWSQCAFNKAKEAGKPLFVFIGYGGSEGSRLMSQEAFLDTDIAQILNDHFIPFLVDKDLLPGVADFYMKAMRATGEAGGWPLLSFCDSDGRPYFLGTYYSKVSKFGKPPFLEVCETMAHVYQNRRESVLSSCQSIVKDVQAIYDSFNSGTKMEASELGESLHVGAAKKCLEFWDSSNGGFGKKPKFPFLYALLYLAKSVKFAFGDEFLFAFLHQCKQMAQGGIIDLVDGGVSAYSTAGDWSAPVPEKNLRDQGLLLQVYSKAYELSQNEKDKELYTKVIKSTVKALKETFLAEDGGFYDHVSTEHNMSVSPRLCVSNAVVLNGLLDASATHNSNDIETLMHDCYTWMRTDLIYKGQLLREASGQIEARAGDHGSFVEVCLRMAEKNNDYSDGLDLAVQMGKRLLSKFVCPENMAMSIDPLDGNSQLPLTPFSYEDEDVPGDVAYGLTGLIQLSKHPEMRAFGDWPLEYVCSKADLARQRPLQMTHVLHAALEL